MKKVFFVLLLTAGWANAQEPAKTDYPECRIGARPVDLTRKPAPGDAIFRVTERSVVTMREAGGKEVKCYLNPSKPGATPSSPGVFYVIPADGSKPWIAYCGNPFEGDIRGERWYAPLPPAPPVVQERETPQEPINIFVDVRKSEKCPPVDRGRSGKGVNVTVLASDCPPPAAPAPVSAPASAPTLAISPSAQTVEKEGMATYRALYRGAAGGLEDVTASSLWTSSAPQVAVVNGAGNFAGIRPGTAPITATYQSLTATAALTVVKSKGDSRFASAAKWLVPLLAVGAAAAVVCGTGHCGGGKQTTVITYQPLPPPPVLPPAGLPGARFSFGRGRWGR